MRHIVFAAIGSVTIATGSLAADAPAASPSGELSIAHFTRFSEFDGAKLSPSGEHAAILTGKYGRTVLHFYSLKEKKQISGFRCEEGMEFYDFEWISDRRIVYQLAERQPGRAAPTPTGEMFAIDYDGKKRSFIYGYRAGQQQTGSNIRVRQATYGSAEIISPLYNDGEHILISEMLWKERDDGWYYNPDAKPIIHKLDVFDGQKRKVGNTPLASASVLVDQNDEVRFAVGQDDQFKLAAAWKPDANGPWAPFSLEGFRSDSLIPRAIATDNQSVLFTATREGEATNALYRLTFATRAVTKVHSVENADIVRVIYDFSGREVVGTMTYVDKPSVQWLNPSDRAARVHAALRRAFPEQSVNVVSKTRDGSLAVVFVESDVNPGDYFLFDTTKMKAEYLQSARRWIDPAKMRKREPFAFKARDGVQLHGYVTIPAGTGPHPIVVLPHGGPHGIRDRWEFDWEAQLLANRGYAVVQVNFRGSGGYGDAFEESGYREWGAKIQDDITDATLWAVEQKIGTRDRICIFGASFGGYSALQGAVREPALYRCAIGYAGVYDLELMLSSADIPKSRSGRAYLTTALGRGVEELRSRSPTYNAEKIQVPVLLIHGKEDGRADFEHAKRMKAALEQNNKAFEWMALSREGHGVYDEETRREVYERILKFLDTHLKSAP